MAPRAVFGISGCREERGGVCHRLQVVPTAKLGITVKYVVSYSEALLSEHWEIYMVGYHTREYFCAVFVRVGQTQTFVDKKLNPRAGQACLGISIQYCACMEIGSHIVKWMQIQICQKVQGIETLGLGAECNPIC